MSDSLSFAAGGRHDSFKVTSLSTALSSMASANRFFSLAFLQRLQPLGVGDLKAAVLDLPFVESRAANPVLAADIGCLRPRLLLPATSR